MQYELGIIGAGNMAEAIAAGVIRAGLLQNSQIIAADVSEGRRQLFNERLKIRAVSDNLGPAANCKTLLLSVKPFQMKQVIAEMRSALRPQTLLISIAAGISTATIEQELGVDQHWRVVRAMPNTPMLVGEGMVAITAGKWATADDMALAQRFFSAAASVVQVQESQMDAVTALSGSGPAYVYYLVEYMIEAAKRLGLSDQQASLMARKTALGAARLMMSSADSPQELRRKVTTPGGTTAAAITHLEQKQTGQAIVDAIAAAANRSREMG